MTRDEAIALLLLRATRSGDAALTTAMQTEMNFVQQQVLEKLPTLPWFLVSEFLTATTIPEEERILLPADIGVTGRSFLREHETCSLWLLPTGATDWVELRKDDYDVLYNRYKSATGTPVGYSLDNTYFYLKPTPDVAYSLRMRVYLRDTPLTTNVENNWLKHAADLVIAETGVVLAGQYLHDEMLLARFDAAAQAARHRLLIAHEAREHAGRDYAAGDD
jgi:hypothetical protein